jgi:hypothetical protein
MRFLIPALAAGIVALGASIGPAAPKTPWQLSPYHIQVLVAVEPSPGLAPQFPAELIAGLPARSDAVLGGPWDLTAAAAPPELADRMIAALDSIPADALPKPAAGLDKLMLLAISADAGAYQVAARDFDVRTGQLGGVVRLPVPQAAKLRDAAMEALVKAFAPLALVHAVDQDQVRLRVKASAIPPRDKDVRLVAPGSKLRPVIRFNDASGNLARVQPLPWTALSVTEAGGEEARARVTTALKAGLFASTGRAAEPLALGVVAASAPVTLVLQSARDAKVGRPVYDVIAAQPKGLAVVRSNTRGEVVLPAGAGAVEVRSGQEIFARLPLVSGGDSQVTLPVAADVRLLEAEGYLAAAQDELADLVALRQILIAQARKAIEARQTDEAKAALTELKGLKTRQQFAESLSAAQKRVIAEDLAVQQRIDAMFAETAKLAQEQLDPKPIDDLAAAMKGGK